MLDLYVSGTSWLHRLDPRSKLVLVVLIGTLLLSMGHVLALLAGLIVIHLIFLSAGVPGLRIRWAWRQMLPITVLVLVLWPLFYQPGGRTLLEVWRLRITNLGVIQGAATALRVNGLAFTFLILLFATDQASLVRGLVKVGLPHQWGLTLAIALRYIPTLSGLYVSVREAQQARGWTAEGHGFVERLRSYIPVLVAVIIGSLRMADHLGMALAARGFGSGRTRTVWKDIEFGFVDYVCIGLSIALFGLLMVARFGYGIGAAPW